MSWNGMELLESVEQLVIKS